MENEKPCDSGKEQGKAAGDDSIIADDCDSFIPLNFIEAVPSPQGYSRKMTQVFWDRYKIHVFYAALGEELNYFDYVCEQTKYEFLRESFFDTVYEQVLKRLKEQNFKWARSNGCEFGVHSDTYLTRLQDGSVLFSDHFVDYCASISLIGEDTKTALIDAIDTVSRTPPLTLLIELMHSKYDLTIYYNSANYDGLMKPPVPLLTQICNAQGMNSNRIGEIIEVFAKILTLLIRNKHFGNNGVKKIDMLTKVHRLSDRTEQRTISRNCGFLIENDFFLIAYSYYRYYWNRPAFAPGHRIRAINNELIIDFLGLRKQDDPNKVIITSDVNWAITPETVYFYMFDHDTGWNNEVHRIPGNQVDWGWLPKHFGWKRNWKTPLKGYETEPPMTQWIY